MSYDDAGGDEGNVGRVYKQVGTVGYADYIPGMWYIDIAKLYNSRRQRMYRELRVLSVKSKPRHFFPGEL